MHPALHSWREELPTAFVRLLAYLGGAALLSIAAAQVFQRGEAVAPSPPAARPQWVAIERVFPAFAISIPEAAGVPSHYAIRRNTAGGGRMDILTVGGPDTPDPYLEIRIYRPGSEITRFGPPMADIAKDAADLGPVDLQAAAAPLDSKFGPVSIVTFSTANGTSRRCLGFVRAWRDPMLQLSGWFCRSGEFIQRSMLACALDRLTLLSAGSEPKVGKLFAEAELERSFCGQRDPILAPTPKYRLLWKALENRP